jgi:type III secretion protein L
MDATKIVKAAESVIPKLVKRESISAMLDAVTILDAAREQARAILRDAEDRRAGIFEEAKFEGEKEGLGRYVEAISALREEAGAYYGQAEAELVKLSSAIARKIVGEELRSSDETIVSIAREALTSAHRANSIVIRVHAADARALTKHKNNLRLPAACTVEIQSDATMEPGGCVIESELGIVDARLETQLKVIEAALLRRRS